MIYYLEKHGKKKDEDYWCIEICQQKYELLFLRHFVGSKSVFTLRIGLPYRLFAFNKS